MFDEDDVDKFIKAYKSGANQAELHNMFNAPIDKYKVLEEEEQDAHVVGVRHRGHDAVVEGVGDGAFKAEVGIQHAADDDADEKRGIHFLRDQRQRDRDDRRQKRPERHVEAGRLLRLLPCCERRDRKQAPQRQQRDEAEHQPSGSVHFH